MEAARDQKHIRGQKHLEEVEHKLKSVRVTSLEQLSVAEFSGE